MSHFGFVEQAFPALREDCARAESYLKQDPRSACIYARRSVEGLVSYLYDLWELPLPYTDDLAARMNDAAFKQRTGAGIAAKMNLLRKLGNTAAHAQAPIPPRAALDALRELFHVMVWATFHHSATPQAAPTGQQFDPAKAPQQSALTDVEVEAILAKFKAHDEAMAQALAEKDELKAAHDAEITQLRAEIAAIQSKATRVDDHDYSEAETRTAIIDLLLAEAGWPLTEARDREFRVEGMPSPSGLGYVDYVLWGADGLPLALVEAKRTTKSALEGQQQAKLYADCVEKACGRRPVIFYSNGYSHYLWDDAAGYPPREVQGFYTRAELELMIQRRGTRLSLVGAPIDPDIAGRHYQQRAIKLVGEAFDARQRESLLVMATGSGKTRVTIALVDQLMKMGWAKRVLFLADRTALVTQAANAFKAHLPAATTVNLLTEKNTEGRVYVSTYPTMMNLIDDLDVSTGSTSGLRRFGPGYFDLVVIDEAHRSVYQKYGAIFEWFDSLLLGLTATPKDEVDHNTYRLFRLEDGVPTDAYSLDEAVLEGYLVPPKGVSVGTKFLRHGIAYNELSQEEKDDWDLLDWGEDGPPDAVDPEALNKFLFNADTVDQVLATLMADGYQVAGGEHLAKTIVFAKNQAHADFIYQRFTAQYPHLGGDYARVITHSTSYAQSLIDDFSNPAKQPHVAISVDMLDTGIDVPQVANLVFFKMVRSKSKFWQILGRGTRLCPDLFGPGEDKKDFLVFDFCGNLEYFSQDPAGSEGSNQKSLDQRLFEIRTGLALALDKAGTEPALKAATLATLRSYVAGMNVDNFLVRPHRQWVDAYSEAAPWDVLHEATATEVLDHLAGLPSGNPVAGDEHAKRFDVMVLRHQLAQLESDGATAERIRGQVQQIAAGLLLKLAIPAVKAHDELLQTLGEDEWWVDVTLPMLELMRTKIRGLVQFLDKGEKKVVYTDFADELTEATHVALPGTNPGTDMERFRAKAAAYLREHEDLIALQRLRRNKPLTADDLVELERVLLESGFGDESLIASAAESAAGLGLFVRSLVGLDRAAAAEAFAGYLDEQAFTSTQLKFVNLIIDELTRNGVMEPARLFESPYTDHAPTGPDFIFKDDQVIEIVATLRQVKANAAPVEVA